MKKFLVWLIGGIALFILAGFLLPRHVKGSASTDIKAPPHTLSLIVSSMRQFNRWSPWHDIDPNTTYRYEGPYTGVGSGLIWSSDSRDVGKGAQKVTAVEPGKSVNVHVTFVGQGGLDAKFVFEPLATRTRTTWSYDYDTGNNPVGRWIGLFMKGAILKDYNKGLAKLKSVAEAAPQTSFEDFDAKIVDEPAVTLAAIAHDAPISARQIAATLTRDYSAIGAALAEQNLQMSGAPRAAYEPVGEPGKPDSQYKVIAQIPVPATFIASGKIARTDVPAGPALRVIYYGTYDDMNESYEKAFAYLKTLALEPGVSYEEYIDDPKGKNPKDVRTDIVIPVRY